MNEKDKWLDLLYARVDSNLTVARDGYIGVHQWIISLTIAGLTAVFALNDVRFAYPSEQSFIIVLLLIPLIFRFFVRSCLEYTIFYRWLTLRNKMDEYFYKMSLGEKADDKELDRIIKICLIGQNSVKPFWTMVYDNLRMAFLWPMLIIVGLTVIGFLTQPLTPLVTVVLIAVVLMMIYEVYGFVTYRRFKYEPIKPA